MVGGLWSIGSFADHITNLVGPSNVPTSISGITMNNLIWQQAAVVENSIGVNLDDAGIEEKYQPTITNLSLSQIYDTMGAMLNVQSAQIDDLKITNNKEQYKNAALSFKQMGMVMLEDLTNTMAFKKVWGV